MLKTKVHQGQQEVVAQIMWPRRTDPGSEVLVLAEPTDESEEVLKISLEAIRASNINLYVTGEYEGDIVVALWSGAQPQEVLLKAYFVTSDGRLVQHHPYSILEGLLSDLHQARGKLVESGKRIAEFLGDEHLRALRHSRESTVRLLANKVMKRVLELGILLGRDWQSRLDKILEEIRR